MRKEVEKAKLEIIEGEQYFLNYPLNPKKSSLKSSKMFNVLNKLYLHVN
jgi:hypothetical protein